MPLTQLQIIQAKPREKLYKLGDGNSLFLWVFPDGAKRWRMAYRFDGKQKELALGVSPEMGLKDAREKRDAARKLLASGVDPNQQKKRDKLVSADQRTNTFKAVAAEVLEKKKREGKAEATLEQIAWCHQMANESLGTRPIADITVAEVLAVLRRLDDRGRHRSAQRLKSKIGEVFRHAMATGRAANDPTSAMKGALTAPTRKNFAAIVKPAAFGGLLRAIDAYEGAPETRIALQLLPLTFVRPGTLRRAEWSQFDFDGCVWNIPAEIMKGVNGKKRPHFVPLPPQALALLRELQGFTGRGKFLFPSVRTVSRCMSENTINAALRRMGFTKEEMTGHGFRSSASTLLNESGLWNPDAIEAQLAHVEANEVRRAYARGQYWDERVRMMAWWANKCDEMRRGGEVVPLRA